MDRRRRCDGDARLTCARGAAEDWIPTLRPARRLTNMNPFRLLAVCLALAFIPAAAAQASVPGASTGPATNVTAAGATLTGVVNPNKDETTYAFEYGTTTAYGARTPDATVSGNAGKDVEQAVTGLAPGTVHHFRLVVANASGSDLGADMTFTTTASPYTMPPAITIGATPATIRFGATSVVSGQLTGPGTAGTLVQLQQNPFPFSAFADLGAPVATDASGNYSFSVKPGLNTRYRAVAKTSPPVTSAEVGVLVRYRVSLGVSDSKVRRGQRVRFRGAVAPAHDGRKVKLQRRTSSGFKTVAKATLRTATAGRSVYSKRIRVNRRGTYRVRVTADADHAAAVSRTRKIRIG